MPTPTIIYTKTDEAPMLATYSLLPIVKAFAKSAGVDVQLRDISLAGRILAAFASQLPGGAAAYPDHLAELGKLCTTPEANIIKLPNISASVPQLKAAISELRAHGLMVPEYPEKPGNDAEKAIFDSYAKVLGSAVNPVLREGNSDRRCAASVKAAARKNPHKVGAWTRDSKTRVHHMTSGDFYESERSHVFASADDLKIEHVASNGTVTVLKASTKVTPGEIIDASRLRAGALRACYASAVTAAKAEGLLLSLHLKATMMKVSDPILFGHAVSVVFADLYNKHAATFARLGIVPTMGLGDLFAKIASLPEAEKNAIVNDYQSALANGPALAYVNSDKGITNLHVSSDVIVDASMPAMIRDSGKMWNKEGKLQDTLAVIPDRCYAGVYQACIDFHREHGAFNPATMGSVANVGLMAQQAEEYGSHNKTFEIKSNGTVRVVSSNGTVLLSHPVETGDLWRMCQTKDIAVQDWVKLAVTRARLSQTPVVFWLDANRSHDRALIAKVDRALQQHDTNGLDIRIHDPITATKLSLTTIKSGADIISATGNVLRDYLTDLFPILELGTSAKMLSIVPLLAGGGLFETGAGGSAPKHVQQFQSENFLRWDSLGEFLALQVSFEDLGQKTSNQAIAVLAKTLDSANAKFLDTNKNPARAVGAGIDNRGSHFYLALYWAQALASQTDDKGLATRFAPLAAQLTSQEAAIVSELNAVQGKPADVGGYYHPDNSKANAQMRPSPILNRLIDALG